MSRILRGLYHTVFCDVGETIVHFDPGFTETFVAEAEALGSTVTEDKARLVTAAEWDRASNDPKWRGASANAERSQAFWMELYKTMGSRLGVADVRTLAEQLYLRFSSIESYAALDGARESLARLRESGMRVVAASNWEPWLEDLLENLELRELFDDIAVSGLIGTEKPDRAFFERALEIAGATADEAVHIGDSFTADVEGAWGAGLDAVWINRWNYPARPCPTVRTFREATDLVLDTRNIDGQP